MRTERTFVRDLSVGDQFELPVEQLHPGAVATVVRIGPEKHGVISFDLDEVGSVGETLRRLSVELSASETVRRLVPD